MKKSFFIYISAIAILFVLIGMKALSADREYARASVTIGTSTFEALVADTEALRERGLSGRKGLEADQAMLFVFDTPDPASFWMKDMLFSIDMLWVDADLHIISFEKNVSPDTYPKIFSPSGLSLYVIEFPAGTLDRVGATKGNRISIEL